MVLLFSALGLLAVVVVYDLLQRQHAILRNFPIIGHVRYWLEAVGPELRQYIVTNNNEERPFSRDQRRWVYASSKQANTSFGFGSDQDMERQSNYLVIKHQTFPLQTPGPGDPAYDPKCTIACAKVLGAARGRAKAFRPASVVNVSGMSFGSLSGPAVEALNRGAQIAGCLHNTGEGGVSPHHLHGGELIWQIGTALFRLPQRRRHASACLELVKSRSSRCPQDPGDRGEDSARARSRACRGNSSRGRKLRAEISRDPWHPDGDRDCAQPCRRIRRSSGHRTQLLDFVESDCRRQQGCRSASSLRLENAAFWDRPRRTNEGDRQSRRRLHLPSMVAKAGLEPDRSRSPTHVALPFKIGFSRVYQHLRRCTKCSNNGSCSWGPGGSGFRKAAVFAIGPRLRHDQRSPGKRCSPSAAFRPSAATRTIARPVSRPSIPGSFAAWTRP